MMLVVADFYPIDTNEVENKWKRVFNIPNTDWPDFEKKIAIVNNIHLPLTLRTYTLNNLPYSIIEIINSDL